MRRDASLQQSSESAVVAEPPVHQPTEILHGDDIVNIKSIQNEVDDLDEGVEETEQQLKSMESFYEAAIALENLGKLFPDNKVDDVNITGAKILGVALEDIYTRIDAGVDSHYALEGVVTIEEVGPKVKIALEGLVETVRKIWEAIKKMIKKSIDYLVERFQKMFGYAERVHSRAVVLKKRVASVSGAPQVEKFEAKSLVQHLHINGKVEDPVGAIENLQKITNAVFDPHLDYAERFVEAIEAETEERADEAFMKITDNKSFMSITHKLDNPESQGLPSNKDGIEMYRSEELIGGKAIIALRLKEPVSDIKSALASFANVGTYVSGFNGYDREIGQTELKLLSKAEIQKIAASAEIISDHVRKYRDVRKKIDALKVRIIRVADAQDWKAMESDDKEKAELIHIKQKLSYATPRLLDEPQAQFSVYCLKAAAAMLDYCEASLKHYA